MTQAVARRAFPRAERDRQLPGSRKLARSDMENPRAASQSLRLHKGGAASAPM